jgi:hypothetical protein
MLRLARNATMTAVGGSQVKIDCCFYSCLLHPVLIINNNLQNAITYRQQNFAFHTSTVKSVCSYSASNLFCLILSEVYSNEKKNCWSFSTDCDIK